MLSSGQGGRSKGDVMKRATARGAMEEGGVSESWRGRRSEETTHLNTSLRERGGVI